MRNVTYKYICALLVKDKERFWLIRRIEFERVSEWSI